MTGHQIAEAFATLGRVIEERDVLREELARRKYEAAKEARTEYRKGYCAGYAARKTTEGRVGSKPHSRRGENSRA